MWLWLTDPSNLGTTPAAWAARHGYGTAVSPTRQMAHVDKLHDKDNMCTTQMYNYVHIIFCSSRFAASPVSLYV